MIVHFGKWNQAAGYTMCIFGLYQYKCMAEDMYNGSFNLEECDYITTKE